MGVGAKLLVAVKLRGGPLNVVSYSAASVFTRRACVGNSAEVAPAMEQRGVAPQAALVAMPHQSLREGAARGAGTEVAGGLDAVWCGPKRRQLHCRDLFLR